MPDAHDFLLRVTAGPSYDTATHKLVHVNAGTPIEVESDYIRASINVRIQNYRGLPIGSPASSPYFEHDAHKHDLYSISFSFVLKGDGTSEAPAKPVDTLADKENADDDHEDSASVSDTTSVVPGINGNELLFGNDFDHPIRDRLPPGFNTAFRIVKWAIDPGLQGDVYADEPYLYGPLLSSINIFGVGDKSDKPENLGSEEEVLEEGGTDQGLDVRDDADMPEDAAARKKDYLHEPKRQKWIFEEGRKYWCDFFNPYLDFNEFSLKLPGFTLPIIRYWDGQPLRSHALRYVLKHKTIDASVDRPLFVVIFTLVPKEEVEREGIETSESKDDESNGQHTKAEKPNSKPPQDEAQVKAQTAGPENEQVDSSYIDEGVD